MGTTLKRLLISMFALTALMAFAASALAIPPNILPGFPMRAGPMVMMMWSPVPGATEYKIMRRAEGKDWEQVAKQPAPPFNDMTADAATTYEYQIIPVVGGVDGEPSAIAKLQGQKKLEPPQITGARPTHEEVQLRWSPIKGAAFYNLYRAVGTEAAGYTLLGSGQDTKYTDAALEPQKDYFYQVTAVDTNSNESPRSPAMKVTTEAPPKVTKKVEEIFENWKTVSTFTGEPMYEFKTPLGCRIAPNGNIHVIDQMSIQVVDKDGNFLRRYGMNPEEGWGRPGWLHFMPDKGEVYVAYYGNGVVRVFDIETGAFKYQFGYAGYNDENGNPMAANPNAVTTGADGTVYIVDSVLRQMVALDPNTKPPFGLIARVGRPVQLYKKGETRPDSDLPGVGVIAYDRKNDKIITGEKGTATLKAFSPAEVKKATPDLPDAEKIAKVDLVFGGNGGQAYNLNGLASVTFGKDNTMYVSDPLLNKVKLFRYNDDSKEYDYVTTWIGDSEDAQQKKKLDINFLSGCDYNDDTGRLYCMSSMENSGYIFERAK